MPKVASGTSRIFLYRLVGSVMILGLLEKVFAFALHGGGYQNAVFQASNPDILQSWEFSEFLINFQGGFVRRGLLGELLLWFSTTTGISPRIPIVVICITAYAVVFGFFLSKFKKGGYSWWLILSPLMCGFITYIVRKDYLLYAVAIAIFCLVKNSNPALWRRFAAFMLAALGLFIHEAFIFWGIPIFALILLSDRRHRSVNISMIAILFGIFGVLSIFKGNYDVACAINESWNNNVAEANLTYTHRNSIGALAWTTSGTMVKQILKNTGATSGFMGIVYWPLLTIAIYYLTVFFFRAFRPTKSLYDVAEQNRLSAILLILFICMLPMFVLLSCDYGRLYQYVVITAMAAFMILDREVIDRMLPGRIVRWAAKTDTFLSRIVSPNKWVIALLLITIGISRCYFNPVNSMLESPIGATVNGLCALFFRIIHL